jgi:DNA-binding transcriptional ArsR family regulator
VIRYRFGHEDLLRTRFAIAPLMELVGAMYALRDPTRYSIHRPWVDWARPRIEGLDLSLFDVATPVGGPFWPVFVGPPPRAPAAGISEELRRVRATPPDLVRAELERSYPAGVPAAGRLLVEDPARGRDLLVGQMRELWDAALAPWWSRIVALLESEIAWRARRLAAVGPRAAFTALHDTVRWSDGVLHVQPTRKAAATVDLNGRGLLLVPAVFTWPSVWPRTDPPWDPALVYPPSGIAELWDGDGVRDGALEALVGQRRARILLELDIPSATLELARRMTVSPGSVSEHLGVLKRAGLVTGRREGRRVVYTRTANGDVLCGGHRDR